MASSRAGVQTGQMNSLIGGGAFNGIRPGSGRAQSLPQYGIPAAKAVPPGTAIPRPPSTPPPSAGGSLSGLQAMSGAGATSVPSAPMISAPPAQSIPLDIPAPVAPASPTEMPPDLAGGQNMTDGYTGRGSIGGRLPPSLAALLKPKVY